MHHAMRHSSPSHRHQVVVHYAATVPMVTRLESANAPAVQMPHLITALLLTTAMNGSRR